MRSLFTSLVWFALAGTAHAASDADAPVEAPGVKDAARAAGKAKVAVSPAAKSAAAAVPSSLFGTPARELRRLRVKLAPAKGVDEPVLPAPIAWGGMRDVPAVIAPPKAAPAPGEPDLAYGAFQRGYYLTALNFALPRAEAGDPAAQTLIGELYNTGRGVSRDRDAAQEWFRLAAERGDPEAQFAYASNLMRGLRRGEPRPREAREYMERAAKAGHARAQFNLAQIIVDDRPSFAGFRQAKPFYEAAAEQGLPDAQYALATMLAEGNGTVVPDLNEARMWLERAAANGFDTAQLELGIWMVNGKGGAKDVEGGRAWLERAARDGNVVAQNRLARMHAFGIGTLIDPVRAGAWHVLTKRVGFSDPEMDRQFSTYAAADQKAAIRLASGWRLRGRVQPRTTTAGGTTTSGGAAPPGGAATR